MDWYQFTTCSIEKIQPNFLLIVSWKRSIYGSIRSGLYARLDTSQPAGSLFYFQNSLYSVRKGQYLQMIKLYLHSISQ